MSRSVETGLAVTDLGFAYGPEPVLDRVSMTLPRGRVGVVVGPSGCGKSTLLALVGGLMVPDRGSIDHAFARPAFVFQDPLLLPWRNAADNIAFGLKAQAIGRDERRARADALLDTVGLSVGDGGKYPHELSGGMRHRVALARALAVDPDLLLLDEPFNALDHDLRRQMQTLVRRLIDERRLTAVMVTHDLAEAVRLADRVFLMSAKPSRVVACHDIDLPFGERDDAFVLAEAAALRGAVTAERGRAPGAVQHEA
jgi:NitT/TauT family transport system ATP-binding protein